MIRTSEGKDKIYIILFLNFAEEAFFFFSFVQENQSHKASQGRKDNGTSITCEFPLRA